MSRQRMIRVNALLKRELASALFRIIHEAGFDLAAVSITGVDVGRDLRTARVRVSIRDHREERAGILNLLRRHRVEFQEQLRRHVILKYIPKLVFELDESIEQGNHMLEILQRLEEPGGERRA